MFKKPFKVSGSHSLSNKDKKKLREKLEKKQQYSKELADFILDDSNYDSDEELRVCKIAQSKCAYYQRGANPLLFCADGDKLNTHVPIEPSLYLMFQQTLLTMQSGAALAKAAYDSSGAVRVYLKQDVEKFLFRGADLMWPGIFHISTEEFKQNDVVVILARNTLISDYISTLGDDDNENGDSEGEEETKDDEAGRAPTSLRQCPNNHPLVYRLEAKERKNSGGAQAEGVNLICDGCKKSINSKYGYFSCDNECDFDLCSSCG